MQPHPFRVRTAVSVLSCLPLCSAAVQNPDPPKQLMGSVPESSKVPHAEILRRLTTACVRAFASACERAGASAHSGGEERQPLLRVKYSHTAWGLSSRILTACNKICATESS